MNRKLDQALSRTASMVWRELELAEAVHPHAVRDPLEIPAALRSLIARVIPLERDDGRGVAAETLMRHYTELMPRMRIEQLANANAVGAELMHAPLRWEHLLRMRTAIGRFFEVLQQAGIDPSDLWGTPDAETFCMFAPTLGKLYARTYYGGCMPLLYGYPADLAYFQSRGLSVEDTIDRYLTAPVIHELCHLDRERDTLCPHLDECVAGWLGVHVWPEFAYPTPGHDDALYASPWLAQIGAAMVRVFGLGPVVRAHAGRRDELPRAFLQETERMYWELWMKRRPLHFLADTFDPKPWLAVIVDAAPIIEDRDADRAIIADALRAMCLETEQVGGSFRTRTVVPTTPIVVETGGVSTAPKNALDTVAPWYWLPPTVHVDRHEVVLRSIEEIPALAAALVP